MATKKPSKIITVELASADAEAFMDICNAFGDPKTITAPIGAGLSTLGIVQYRKDPELWADLLKKID